MATLFCFVFSLLLNLDPWRLMSSTDIKVDQITDVVAQVSTCGFPWSVAEVCLRLLK
jgi:Na+-translocating ferredoxin:NAD+ oxidoreductase RNF subunit RnfB